MYAKRQGLVIGFHGCSETVCNGLLNKQLGFRPSRNDYDWLGEGMYFWEHDIARAYSFIREKLHREGSNERPTVIGAILDLGLCLDLLKQEDLQLVKRGYTLLTNELEEADVKMPENKKAGALDFDFKLRNLDCAVIQLLHKNRKIDSLPPFDSVRGVFWEGSELYPNAGFRDRNHVQLCVRNPNCILGFFLPKEVDEDYPEI